MNNKLKNNQLKKISTKILLVLFSVGLFLCYLFFTLQVPHGLSEFAYYPAVPEPILFSPIRGFTYEQMLGHVYRIGIATPALLCLVWGIRMWVRHPEWSGQRVFKWAIGCSFLSLFYMTWLMFGVLRGKPLFLDELTYLEQARLLLDGSLGYSNLPYYPELFFMFLSRVGYNGKYLFGEPIVQAVGLVLGHATVVHLLLAALTLFCIYRAMNLATQSTSLASWSVILIAVSPMFAFTTVTGMSQASSLCCMAIATYGCYRIYDDQSIWGALFLGFGVGFGVAVRPQSAVPIGVVLVLAALHHLIRHRSWRAVVALSVSLGFWATLILIYNTIHSGHPLHLPWFLSDSENYGFGKVEANWNYYHTFYRGLENLVVQSVRWNAWWLGWPSSLLLFVAWFAWKRPMEGAKIWVWSAGAVILFQFAYYSTGPADTGPIYHYELLIPAALLGANVIVYGLRHYPKFTKAALLCHFILGTTTFFTFQHQRISRYLVAVHRDIDNILAKVEKGKKKALVLFEEDCSERFYFGWFDSGFPRRAFSEDAKIIYYPRKSALLNQRLILRYAKKRDCFYSRHNPKTKKLELLTCKKAKKLLTRPYDLGKACLWNPPTAFFKTGFNPTDVEEKLTNIPED